jgi:hypothetical protein
MGDKVNKCMLGTEQYFVRFGLDPLPVSYVRQMCVGQNRF